MFDLAFEMFVNSLSRWVIEFVVVENLLLLVSVEFDCRGV